MLANTVVYFVITCISFWYIDLGQFLYTIKKIEIQVFYFFTTLDRTAVVQKIKPHILDILDIMVVVIYQ